MKDYTTLISEALANGQSLEDIGNAFADAMNAVKKLQEEERALKERQLSLIDSRKNEICDTIVDLLNEYMALNEVALPTDITEDKNELINIVREALDTAVGTLKELKDMTCVTLKQTAPKTPQDKKNTNDAQILKDFINEEMRKGDLKAPKGEDQKKLKVDLKFNDKDLLDAISFLDKLFGSLSDKD